jgi:hypothetical protein
MKERLSWYRPGERGLRAPGSNLKIQRLCDAAVSLVGSQEALLGDFFVTLDVVADCEAGPVLEADTALGVLAHFGHVLLDVLERGDCAWIWY